MKLSVSLAALVLSSSAAVGQVTCPTMADLDQGITLIRGEPFYSNVMTHTEDGLAEARIVTRDGVRETVSSTYAHALAVTQRIGANGTLGLTYAGDTFEMDQLDTLGTWMTDVTLSTDGVPTVTGTFRATFVARISFPIGACEFETWQVRTELDLADRAPLRMDRYFAPALGISLGAVSLDADGNPISGVIFDDIKSD